MYRNFATLTNYIATLMYRTTDIMNGLIAAVQSAINLVQIYTRVK